MSKIDAAIQQRHNRRNTLHTILLIVGTGLIMGVLAYTMFGWTGLVGAAAFGAFGIMSLGRVSPKMVLGLYKARPLQEQEAPELHQIMRELAKRADLPAVPTLHCVPTKMMNAFAVGNINDSAVAVTDGLLRAMNMRQIAGILASSAPQADVATRAAAIAAAEGSPGAALDFVDQDLGKLHALMLRLIAEGDEHFALRGALTEEIGMRPDRERQQAAVDLARAVVAAQLGREPRSTLTAIREGERPSPAHRQAGFFKRWR